MGDENPVRVKGVNPNNYLSPEWRSLREKHLKERCEACGIKALGLHLHHRRYHRHLPIGTWETPKDVLTLCKTCHGVLHPQGKGRMPTDRETDMFLKGVRALTLPLPLPPKVVWEVRLKTGKLARKEQGRKKGRNPGRPKGSSKRRRQVESLRRMSDHPVLGRMASQQLQELEARKKGRQG